MEKRNGRKEEFLWEKAGTGTFNPVWSCSFSVGLLGDASWPPAFEFLDFLKLMDMEEEEEHGEEEYEDFPSFSSAEISDDNPIHTEL